jgi:twitching motility protein PilT
VSTTNLPASLADVASLEHGIVLVTSPTGSGKSSTLAAINNLINKTRTDRLYQRELHSDTRTSRRC